ncbi:MAG: 50S ribosomal protein L19 [bacterium]|nr:50S ribosomal protein L19 [bacterium]
MANRVSYKEIQLSVGDMITVHYKIKEGEKERVQLFKGVLIKIKGMDDANRMITVRKMSNDGIGVERVMPLQSSFIANITIDKASSYTKSKLYFIRDLSGQQLRNKLYSQKKATAVKNSKSSVKKVVKEQKA